MAFTHSRDERPIVATRDLCDCIGIIGYDAKAKYGFIAHLFVNTCLDKPLLKQVFEASLAYMQALEGKKEDLKLTLAGGLIGKSEDAIAAIKTMIAEYQLEVVSEEHLLRQDTSQAGTNVALHVQTGEIDFNHQSEGSHLFPLSGKELSSQISGGKKKFRRLYIAYAALPVTHAQNSLSQILPQFENKELALKFIQDWLIDCDKCEILLNPKDLDVILEFVGQAPENQAQILQQILWRLVGKHRISLKPSVATILLTHKSAQNLAFDGFIENRDESAVEWLVTVGAELNPTNLYKLIPYQFSLLKKILSLKPELLGLIDEEAILQTADCGGWEMVQFFKDQGLVMDPHSENLQYLSEESRQKVLAIFCSVKLND